MTSSGQVATQACSPVNVSFVPLSGTCSTIVNPIGSGQYQVTWNAQAFAPFGFATPVYSWVGPDGITSNISQLSGRYSTLGVKSATVSIIVGGQTFSLTCNVDVHSNLSAGFPLGGSCTPSARDMTVSWQAGATGGSTTTPAYTWTGLDGLATTSANASQIYTTEGTKSGTINIQSGNESLAMMCQARVASSTSSGGGHCFIATAAFGTPLEPEVQTLRKFRDDDLMANTAGRLFVDLYYTVSPPIADFIRDKETLKAIVRAGLTPIIYIVDKTN